MGQSPDCTALVCCLTSNVEELGLVQQAALAQLVEQLPRKEQVWGSIPQGGSMKLSLIERHEEWPENLGD